MGFRSTLQSWLGLSLHPKAKSRSIIDKNVAVPVPVENFLRPFTFESTFPNPAENLTVANKDRVSFLLTGQIIPKITFLKFNPTIEPKCIETTPFSITAAVAKSTEMKQSHMRSIAGRSDVSKTMHCHPIRENAERHRRATVPDIEQRRARCHTPADVPATDLVRRAF
jgi:hypothetical protein